MCRNTGKGGVANTGTVAIEYKDWICMKDGQQKGERQRKMRRPGEAQIRVRMQAGRQT